MAYELCAFLARKGVFEAADVSFPVVELPCNMELLLVDWRLAKELGVKRWLIFNREEMLMDRSVATFGKAVSKGGKTVAFLQAVIFEGSWDQVCAVWQDGEQVRVEFSKDAINHAIKEIDPKVAASTEKDAFDCLNLGRCRYTDKWLEIGDGAQEE